jgi:hypothetical protein
MKSWAHTYLAGSLLGAALIVAALVAFVPLVALKAPDEWPALGLGLGGSGGSDIGVSAAAIVTTGQPPHTAGLGSSPTGSNAGSAATVAVHAPSREISSQPAGGADVNAAPEPVAVSPASAEVVARNPSPPAPEGAAPAPPPPPANPPETGSAPVVAPTGGEAGSPGETPPTLPIVAGVGGEEPETLPPEGSDTQPPEDVGSTPPPLGGSIEAGNAPGLPGTDDEGEEAQSENGEVPADSALDFEPGVGWRRVWP